MASGNQHPVFARGDKKQPGTQRRSRFDRYGDTPDSLIDDLTMLKATAEARLRICGDDHKAAAALIRESRCIDEAVAKIRGFLEKGSHHGCIAVAKHQAMIGLVTEALREFPEARMRYSPRWSMRRTRVMLLN
jgi:hypothetical protein